MSAILRVLKAFRTYGPSLWRPKLWASMPVDSKVGGALLSRPWQVFGGKSWSLTLHTSMSTQRFARTGEHTRMEFDR